MIRVYARFGIGDQAIERKDPAPLWMFAIHRGA